MTDEEALAEQASEFARLKSGEMSGAEAEMREAAWRRAGEWLMERAEKLEHELRQRKPKKLGIRPV